MSHHPLLVNIRLRRCAQVIAMDGMYVGFAGAKTDHCRALFNVTLVVQ
jgi:hypothetical protein